MGFLPAVRRLLDQVRPDRQTFLFSATLDGEVDVLIRRYQRDPFVHEVETPAGEQDLRQHLFWKTDREGRANMAAQIVARHTSTLVFCRTKRGADRLARQLSQAGLAVAAIHGDRSQAQREKALAAFSTGRVQALVATDVAARGIHVDAVGCVLHFDPPEDGKAYVHRSGRTGRAGAGGTVLSLVTVDQAADVKALQKALGLPRTTTDVDLAGLGPVVQVQPQPVKPPATTPDSSRRKRPQKQWAASGAIATPRRKPDGRPVRAAGRHRSQGQTRRARPA
jgi:superfamily II DNA/RNA helicase